MEAVGEHCSSLQQPVVASQTPPVSPTKSPTHKYQSSHRSPLVNATSADLWARSTPREQPVVGPSRNQVHAKLEIFERRSSVGVGPAEHFKGAQKLSNVYNKRGSCGPGVSVTLTARATTTSSKSNTDYEQVRERWKSRTTQPKEAPKPVVNEEKRLGILNRLRKLRRRRQDLKEPEIVRSVARRGSTGKMRALEPVNKAETQRVARKKSKLMPSLHRATVHSPRDEHHRRRKTKMDKVSKHNHKQEKRRLTRRNSTGGVRFEDEPVVTLYWNPARGRLLDPVLLPDVERENSAQKREEKSTPDMHTRGVIQRRASTGRIRMEDEDTTWLFAREDHEIANANVRGSKSAKKDKITKHKSKESMRAAKEALKAVASGKELKKESSRHAKLRKSKPKKASTSTHSKTHDRDKAQQRKVERRGSTGAVPLTDDAESRLHRKKKMRQEHKRRRREMNLTREGASKIPGASSEARPKASLLGLLDPSMAMGDGSDHPSSWLVGDEEHIFTIAPYKPPPPKIMRTTKMTPRELELELDSDSSDDESHSSIESFAASFFSSRPGTSRRNSAKSSSHNAKSASTEDKTQTTDVDDSDDEFAEHFFSSRPGTTRGHSMDDDESARFCMSRPGRKKMNSALEDDGDAMFAANFFGGRPTTVRGKSVYKSSATSDDSDHLVSATKKSSTDKIVKEKAATSPRRGKKSKTKKEPYVKKASGDQWEFQMVTDEPIDQKEKKDDSSRTPSTKGATQSTAEKISSPIQSPVCTPCNEELMKALELISKTDQSTLQAVLAQMADKDGNNPLLIVSPGNSGQKEKYRHNKKTKKVKAAKKG